MYLALGISFLLVFEIKGEGKGNVGEKEGLIKSGGMESPEVPRSGVCKLGQNEAELIRGGVVVSKERP